MSIVEKSTQTFFIKASNILTKWVTWYGWAPSILGM